MGLRRPEQFSHHFAKLREITLHYVREGAGPALVLVHGWPGFWWEWHRTIGPLAAHFEVIALDMRGYGDSEKPDPSRIELYQTDRVVDDIAELLDQLKIERALFAGHDYGAIVLHKLVREHRARVERAVIINPVVPGFDERYMSAAHFAESWYAKFHQIDMAVELVSSSRAACRAYYGHFLSHWSSDERLFSDEEIEIYTDNYMKPGNILGGFNFYRAGQRKTWNNLDYTVSDCPVTFLQGLDDPCIPSAWTDLVTRWYTNYTIEYLPRCGHFAMREQPELVVDRIRRAGRA